MKKLTLFTLIAIIGLSGCGGESSSSSASTSQEVAVEEVILKEPVTEVIVLSAKSDTVVEENRVNSNTSYTHVGTSGARYTFD